jgi:hypothetical protein
MGHSVHNIAISKCLPKIRHTHVLQLWGRLMEKAYGREMNVQFFGNSSGGHSCSQHAKSVVLCCMTKLHTFEWPFIVPSTRCTCVMIILFNQLLDMPHLPGGWIILAKEKCSITGM